MLPLSKKDLKNIAEELEMGQVAYIHKTTGACIFIPDTSSNPDIDLDDSKDEISTVENNWDEYEKMEPMDSTTMYEIMEDFVNQLKDSRFKETLQKALHMQKPFRRFNHLLHESMNEREEWFAFKTEAYIKWVEDQIKR